MRTNLILFTLLFLASCVGNGDIKNAKEVGWDLVKYDDLENGVTCYSVRGYPSSGVSCVKTKKD